MESAVTYSWQSAYLSAVLETENALMRARIYEALAAIEQRRPSLIATDGIEERAIEDAQRGLLTLKVERTQPGSQTHSDFLESDSPEAS
jgi:hypothetical protein